MTVDANGNVTATYLVTVTNTGTVTAPHPEIADQVTLPPGFTITGVTLDGAAQSTTDGSFTIPAGAADLAPGAVASYTVVVTGSVTDLATTDWATAGTCMNALGGTPSDGGFFNVVTLDGDTDGPDNNDACVPVKPPLQHITVLKQGSSCDVGVATCDLGGAEFQLYDADPSTGAQPIADGITADSLGAATFTSTGLEVDRQYWLVESRAPDGHELLGTPIAFRVTTGGVSLTAGETSLVSLNPDDAFGLIVQDVTAAPLPESGGNGVGANLIGGLLLIAGAFAALRTSRQHPSPRRAA